MTLNTHIKYIIAMIILGAICFSAGKFLTPAKVTTITQEKIVYQDRIITDTTKQVKTHIVETKKLDGTIVTITDTGEQDKTNTIDNKDKSTSLNQSTIVQNRPNWQVSVVYDPNVPSFQPQKYTGIIQKRLFSEIYMGISVSSDHTAGLIVSVGF